MKTDKRTYDTKKYQRLECCIFRKTKEEYGGLSNMASGYPILIGKQHIPSSEALYQACRFPHLPDVQRKIIDATSPMSAKMVSKPERPNSREDWEDRKVRIMRWCLRVKLAQNYLSFGALLESTAGKQIVEESTKDNFWGAIPDKDDPNLLVGTNALGRLLMELRSIYMENKFDKEVLTVEPLNIPNFLLFSKAIELVDGREKLISELKNKLYSSVNKNNISKIYQTNMDF